MSNLEKEDYYKTLEVPETATQEEIKKSYRRLSLLHHPDKNHGNGEKFQKINEAYETLYDEQKRQEYDMMRRNPFGGFPGNGGAGGQGGMDELFANLFFGGIQGMGGIPGMPGIRIVPNGGMQGFFPPGANVKIFRNGTQMNFHQQMEKPTPIVKTINISIEQVLTGATIPVDVERWLIEQGNKIFEHETLYVPIPKGIDDNEIIVLRDKGNVVNEECKGDVKIFIKIDNDSELKRHGLDLIYEKKISLKESLCGFSFELKYINGKVYTIHNTIGNIIKPDYKKVIPNMGLERDGHKGAVIIVFTVEFPDSIDINVLEKIKELL